MISEIGNSTLAATWQTSGRGAASICIQVTQGAWDLMSDTAEQCLNIHISDPGSNPGTGVAIPPTATPQPNSGGGNNGGGSGSSNSCNSHQSYLSTGAIARVDVSLDVYDTPDGRVIDDLSRGKLVTVIGGSACVRGSLRWEIGYDGKSGWATESTTYGSYYMVNNGGSGSSSSGGNNNGANNNGGGSPSPQATPRPSSSACNSLSSLQVGDIAYVSDETPDPLPLRTGASTSHDIIMQVAVREEVTIMGGPNCQENVVWWQVSYNGQPGWMAEINKFNNRNLLFVRGPEVEPVSSAFVELEFHYEPFGDTYVFQVDKSNPSLCVIMNGSGIVAQETVRFSNWAADQYSNQSLANASLAVANYLKSGGAIDTFRVAVIEYLNMEAGCTRSYYLLTTGKVMDLSGLGNVVFGYFSVFLPRWSSHRIADVDQFVKDHQFDFPDDAAQIDWGRNIANSEMTITGSSILPLIPPNWENGM